MDETKRKEANKKVIESTYYQIVLAEANIKVSEEKHEAMKKIYTKEEKAKSQMNINALKHTLKGFKDLLIVLQK